MTRAVEEASRVRKMRSREQLEKYIRSVFCEAHFYAKCKGQRTNKCLSDCMGNATLATILIGAKREPFFMMKSILCGRAEFFRVAFEPKVNEPPASCDVITIDGVEEGVFRTYLY